MVTVAPEQMATASKLDDAFLKNALLTAPETMAIRDAYAEIQPK